MTAHVPPLTAAHPQGEPLPPFRHPASAVAPPAPPISAAIAASGDATTASIARQRSVGYEGGFELNRRARRQVALSMSLRCLCAAPRCSPSLRRAAARCCFERKQHALHRLRPVCRTA
eukprot:3644986-Pleurochrysis_carterae.AAC.1